jgi:hypothetical protein
MGKLQNLYREGAKVARKQVNLKVLETLVFLALSR